MKDQDCEKETSPEREPFYISLGQRFQSFQLAQISLLELPAAANFVFTEYLPESISKRPDTGRQN